MPATSTSIEVARTFRSASDGWPEGLHYFGTTPNRLHALPLRRYSGATTVDAATSDPLLQPFLRAASHAESEPLLADLLERHARPLVTQILRHKAGGESGAARADIEELTADSLSHVLTRLVDLRSGSNPDHILSFSGYVAVVAYNAWNGFLRERFPVRGRLKNRMRYIAGHHPALALWNDGGTTVCGLKKWQGRARSASAAERLRTAENNPDVLHREALRGEPPVNEAAVAAAIVGWAGGPIALEDLVDRAAEVLGLADVPVQTWTGDSDDEGERVPIADTLPDPGRSVLVALTDREELSRLWTEIQDLPVRQRQALLLNLRDGEGRGVVGLLPLTGTASLRQIADALEMGHGELAALWHDLPLDDAAIAGRLSATRQQVINLRKSARERLARRVRADRITTIAAGNTAGRSTSSLTHRA